MMDEALKRHFVELLMMVILIFFCGMYFGLSYGSITMFLFFFVLALALLLYCYYRLRLCLDEKIVFADGEIIEIYNASLTKKKLGRNYILMKQDNIYVRVYYSKVRKFKENNVVRLYFNPNNLRRENDDTFVCDSFFLFTKIKTHA